MITTVLRLSIFPLAEIDLKEAQRFFAQKFSCGASVTGEDEIIIQGDFTDDIIDVIQEKWPEVINPSFCQEHTHFSTPACDFPVILGKGFIFGSTDWCTKIKEQLLHSHPTVRVACQNKSSSQISVASLWPFLSSECLNILTLQSYFSTPLKILQNLKSPKPHTFVLQTRSASVGWTEM